MLLLNKFIIKGLTSKISRNRIKNISIRTGCIDFLLFLELIFNMVAIPGRLLYALSNKIRSGFSSERRQEAENRLAVNFSKTHKSPFNTESTSSYDACLSNGSFTLGLKKTNCIAWAEIPNLEYSDQVIEAKIRIENSGAYLSTGIIFRIIDQDSYYLALVSSKGYFRLDAVKNGSPKALIAWTEIPDFNGTDVRLKIITYGTYIILIINGRWAGESSDDFAAGGRLGFALASYEETDDENETPCESGGTEDGYVCKSHLDYFSADTRIKTVEEQYKKWTCDSNINADSRLRLAETFAVMGKNSKALDQLKRAWKRRDEVIGSVSISYTIVRTRKELLLAARISFGLGQYEEAEEYIDSLLEQWSNYPEGQLACTEKIKVLNELNKFAEIKEFALKKSRIIEKDLSYHTILARAYWELKEYEKSAESWENAFGMLNEKKDDDIEANAGVYAANAANALDMAGHKEKALVFFLEAGKIFLKQDNKKELEAIMPKLSALGKKNWQARALAGKWAFSTEDYKLCSAEFDAAEKLRRAILPEPEADPALFYLWGLAFYLKGNIKQAVRLIKKAVKLAPDYDLFKNKLQELLLTGGK